ncbi:MAG TPA: T9SS type A sorting domain-containing protein, partial [Bacteroidetes bacterium]|nr:T9SS type A sorting domain-containing protein [Bacteroidota bacterium]
GEEAKVKVLFRNTDKSDSFIVFQNTPNPFKNETEIKFSLTQNANVELNVFDITGKIVYKTSGDFVKGISRFVVKSADLSSKGVFYYSLTSNGNKSTKKMIVID